MSAIKGVALIMGSAQGIGRAIALRLARDGFDFALNDILPKHDQLRAVADDIEKIGRKTHLVPADVSVEGDVKGMVQSATEHLGGLDVMVANAGIAKLPGLLSTGLDVWEQVMAINARGVFLCYKYAAAQMIAQGRGGRIIGASSSAGKLGYPISSAYSASKFAVRGLTQSAALELGRYNITVNSYAPGAVETPMTASVTATNGWFATQDQEYVRWIMNHLASRSMKYNGQPEEVASLVSYLASKEAHFITGKTMRKPSYLLGLDSMGVAYSTSLEQISVDGGLILS